LATLVTLALGGAASAGLGDHWPQWRGPTGDGVSDETNLPFQWSEQANVAWKCPLPGKGASTPAIWGDVIFLTAQRDEALLLLKINKTTGRIEWTQQVGTGPKAATAQPPKTWQRGQQKFHALHNLASPSPVTDGELVVVHFGNGDLAAYNFAGKQLWLRNLQQDHGHYTIWWGHANSPILYRNLVISVCMQDSLEDLGKGPAASYLVAHDKRTGTEQWKTLRRTGARAEECDSYTTPILRYGNTSPSGARRAELVVIGGNQIDGYDPATGKQLWFLPGIVGGRTITGPTLSAGLVYATQGMRGPLLAIRPGEGKLPSDAVVWKETQGTADSSCPVVWRELIFWITDNGVVQCRDARTGELKWKERLAGNFKASPVAAEGRIYFLNLAGKCTVIAAAPRFEKLAENQLDDETIASPAVSNGRVYLRGQKNLYCIGGK
jgi:outer membrane protein assembly factor BamB